MPQALEQHPPAVPAIDLGRLTDRAMWAAFAPRLHIEDPDLLPRASLVALNDAQTRGVQAQIRQEGYFQASNVNWGLDLPLMVATIRALSAASLPPVFAFLFDEFWVPFRKLAPIYQSLLGNYAMLPDFWVWDVDPKRSESGWAPHRDKGVISLLPDGSPKSITTWIPLTAATPLNGCMYIVPANHDKTYGTAQENTHTFDMQSIRALPGTPGDFFIWNQAVLHWGGKTSPHATESRISMAVEFQRGDIPSFHDPLLNPHATLPFPARLKLIAMQILQYRHMYKILPEVEKIAVDLTQAALVR
jgi:hypothetical protein